MLDPNKTLGELLDDAGINGTIRRKAALYVEYINELETALKFYADPANWDGSTFVEGYMGPEIPAIFDSGERAREIVGPPESQS